MASTSCNYTQTTPTDNNKWTFSCWFKKGLPSTEMSLFGAWSDGNNQSKCRLMTNGTIEFIEYQSSTTVGKLTTNRALRDPTAWMHIVCVYDSDNASAGDRMRMYINGVEETAFSVDTNPSSGLASINNVSGRVMYVGRDYDGGYWNGAMSWVQFVDGAALAPTEFGEVDSTSGIWKIKTTPYATPGNNGFCLKMEDRSNLDLDSSSNAFTFTTAGTGTATYDNPSNNFATLNPVAPTGAALILANGSTCSTGPNSGNYWQSVPSTLGASAGKWYFEFKDENAWGSTSDSTRRYGICDLNTVVQILSSAGDVRFSSSTAGYAYMNASGVRHNASTIAGTTSTYPTFVPGDILMCAMDLDNQKLYFGKNGTWLDSSDPTSGATGTGAVADISATATWSPYVETHYGSDVVSVNYGNGYFRVTAITSAGTNAGLGEFEYDVPTGYYALCTKNIKAYGG